MEEIWKNIFNGNYAVSNLGRVRANDRIIQTKTGARHYKERILIPEIMNDGHLRVTLVEAGKKERKFVHQLVAEAFIPNLEKLPVINHKDENPANNCVENLEWCTVAYNNAYNNRHARIGDAEGHNIKVFSKSGELLEEYPSYTKAAKAYGWPLSTFYRYIKEGKPICKDKIFKCSKI